jgi:hypothetical protein
VLVATVVALPLLSSNGVSLARAVSIRTALAATRVEPLSLAFVMFRIVQPLFSTCLVVYKALLD